MTAPDKIWATPDRASDSYGTWDCAGIGEYDDRAEYTRTDLAQAAVAAAYEAAAQVAVDRKGFGSDAALVHPYDKGYVAACDAIATAIRALATPDQIAALAASPDTIAKFVSLPRAEVEDVADTLNLVADWMEKSVKDRRIIGPEFHVPTLRKALATLQERMK